SRWPCLTPMGTKVPIPDDNLSGLLRAVQAIRRLATPTPSGDYRCRPMARDCTTTQLNSSHGMRSHDGCAHQQSIGHAFDEGLPQVLSEDRRHRSRPASPVESLALDARTS